MTLSREELFQKVSTTMCEMFGFERRTLQPGTRLVDELDIDSIDAINLVVRLEKILGARIPAEDFRRIRAVQDIVDALHQLLATGK